MLKRIRWLTKVQMLIESWITAAITESYDYSNNPTESMYLHRLNTTCFTQTDYLFK